MRFTALLVLIFLSIGCGAGHDALSNSPHMGVVFSAPSIASLTPNSTPENSVPFTMTVQGTQFGPDAVAFWNNAPQHTVFISSSELRVAVTDDDLMLPGSIDVYVRTGGMNSNTLNFDITP
jgi:IPT/TIG domain